MSESTTANEAGSKPETATPDDELAQALRQRDEYLDQLQRTRAEFRSRLGVVIQRHTARLTGFAVPTVTVSPTTELALNPRCPQTCPPDCG